MPPLCPCPTSLTRPALAAALLEQELAGGAWDAQESRKLKVLRARQADALLLEARDEKREAQQREIDLITELKLETERGQQLQKQ